MLVHEYLKLFVFRKRLVSYEYFMDELQEWEISLLADCLNSGYREEWEMTRWLVYSIIQPNIKKSMQDKSMHELLPLPFDEEYKEEEEQDITNEEIAILKHRSEMLGKQLFKQKDLDKKT